MYDFPERKSPANFRAFLSAAALHLILVGVIWMSGCILHQHQENIIIMDPTIVPPWAEQTDDPAPDPNPPPKVDPQVKPPPKVEPPPEPKEQPKVDAVEKVVEKKKPKEKIDLRKDAKFVKTPIKPSEPVDLRKQATRVEAPPMVKTFGKGTAAEKPRVTTEQFLKMMNEGYRVGTHNQIADNELSRCYSLIVNAIRQQCEREGVRWNAGQAPVLVEIAFGSGGAITRCRLTGSSGDGNVDRLVLNAIKRLGAVRGLSAPFLQQYPVIPASIEPLPR